MTTRQAPPDQRREALAAAPVRPAARVRGTTLLGLAMLGSMAAATALLVATAGEQPVRGPVPVTLEPNVEPEAVGDALVVGEGLTAVIDVAANDRDENGDVLVVQGLEYATGNGATVALSGNLVLNGDGGQRSEVNFSGFEYVPAAGPGGRGAFVVDGTAPAVTDSPIPVDVDAEYALGLWARAEPATRARQFAGYAGYDADGALIRAINIAYAPGSETTLARDLAPGDMEVHLADASGWDDDAPAVNRNFVMYPYTDAHGTTYAPYTYSRHVDAVPPASGGLWPDGGIDGDVIRLREGWARPNPDRADGVWPAGTAVANARTGGSFNFNLIIGHELTEEWQRFEGTIAGVSSGGEIDPRRFRPGTRSIRFVAVPNQGEGGGTAWFSGVEMREAGAVAYTPAPGFVGTDSFSYAVSDLRGGESTATVTVEVVANTAPVAADDEVTTGEGLPVGIDVLVNDSDEDGDDLRVTGIDHEGDNGAVVELAGNLVGDFPDVEPAPGAGPGGLDAFSTDETAVILSEDLIPVDTGHEYGLELWSRAEPNVGARHSAGFASYDADGLVIAAHHVMYARGSETELAQDLAPGDREVRLVDASGWLDGDEPSAFHNIVLYPYTDAQGTTHPPYTYSRHVEPLAGQGPGLWPSGGIEGNVIRLAVPWDRPNPDREDGVWPAGTPLANATAGSLHGYPLFDGVPYGEQWSRHTAAVAGVSTGGTTAPDRFRPGTAFIRFAIVPNRGVSGGTAWYAGAEVLDRDAPAISYVPAPGFSGSDTFAYTVEDGRGGRATASVLVVVEPNEPPVAAADRFDVAPGRPVELDVLANDRDPDGDELTVVAVSAAPGSGATIRAAANLLRNGDGDLGDADNFPGFEFVDGAGPNGVAAFVTSSDEAVVADEAIPVDTSHAYRLEAWSRADPHTGAGHSLGFMSFDADGLVIQPHHVSYAPGSETELTRDLAPGDTEIHLADASGWLQADEHPSRRNIVLYPYTNGQGETYPAYTYSRHTELLGAGVAEGLWAAGAIDGGVIELLEPWDRPNPDRADGVWPAGTLVANPRLGAAHNFPLVQGEEYTPEWVRHSAEVRGVSSPGTLATNMFRPGTASIRFFALPNRGAEGSTAWYAGLRIADLDAPPVLYTPAPGFTGADTFTYVVEDSRGARSTATVTVVVTDGGG